MKIRTHLLITFLLSLLLLIPSIAGAESTPKAVVQKLIEEMAKAKSPLPMLDLVHWDTAFKNLSPQEKAALAVNSPQQLEEKLKMQIKDPTGFMRSAMKQQLESLPPDQKEMMKQRMEPMLANMKTKIDEGKAKFARTTFEVVDSSVEGEKAEVKIKKTVDGQSSEEKIKLVKIDGKWYIPGPDLGARQAPPSRAAPPIPPGAVPPGAQPVPVAPPAGN